MENKCEESSQSTQTFKNTLKTKQKNLNTINQVNNKYLPRRSMRYCSLKITHTETLLHAISSVLFFVYTHATFIHFIFSYFSLKLCNVNVFAIAIHNTKKKKKQHNKTKQK